MTTVEPSSLPPVSTDAELGVSRYDQVSSVLVAVLVVFGTLTGLMFLVWLSSRVARHPAPPVVQVLEDVGGGGSGDTFSPGEQQEFEEPVVNEAPPEDVPVVESTLEAITSVVQEAPLIEPVNTGGFGNGEGTGMGDGRGRGPGGPGTADGVPAWERWEVRMAASNLDTYAKQLDFFGVELGVAGGGSPTVTYISRFADPTPLKRTAEPKEERRLRFLHRSGKLREADRALVTKAGVDPSGKVVFQFYPQQTYLALLALEHGKMGSRRISEVKKTIFGVREVQGKFEFHVISQEYRDGQSSS